jgi:hypothetical protein
VAGLFAILFGFLAFIVPLGLALSMRGWRQLGILAAAAALFFGWLTVDLENPEGLGQALGSFLGGLMLLGFACGVIARTVTLLGRSRNGDGGA